MVQGARRPQDRKIGGVCFNLRRHVARCSFRVAIIGIGAIAELIATALRENSAGEN
jgi:hypothetical protein